MLRIHGIAPPVPPEQLGLHLHSGVSADPPHHRRNSRQARGCFTHPRRGRNSRLRTRPFKNPHGRDGNPADAGTPHQSGGCGAESQTGIRGSGSRLDTLAHLFALAGDPDGRNAGRRRYPAAGPGAQAEIARGGRAGRGGPRNRGAGRAADRHSRGPDIAHPHALYRCHRVGEHPRRRVCGVLGGDIGFRLLLRGHRAFCVQLTDQLAA